MKKMRTFLSGILAMLMIVGLTGTAFAATGKLQAGTAGLIILDKVKVEPGAEYTAGKTKIPAVVNYTDAAGKTHYYLPVEMMPDLLNIDAAWSEGRNSVVLGPSNEGIQPFDPSTYDPNEDPLLKPHPTSPVKGVVRGPFTEIDPKTAKLSEKPVLIVHKNTKVQTSSGFSSGGYFDPTDGKYIVLKVTNDGTAPVTCLAARDMMLGGPQGFPSVDIEAGKTLTRVFSIADGVDAIHGTFTFGVRSADLPNEANFTVSLMQYK